MMTGAGTNVMLRTRMSGSRSRRKNRSWCGINGSGLANSSGRGRTERNRRGRDDSGRRTRDNRSGRAHRNGSGGRNGGANGSRASNSRRPTPSNDRRRRRSNRGRNRDRRWNGDGMHHGFLFHYDRRANGRVFKKRLGHSLRDTNATMRCGVRWDVPLMHGVTTAEEHCVWHSRAVVMGTRRPGILARIDIGFHDVAEIVHVIAKDSRYVGSVFRQNRVAARRGPESGFASGDRRFANEVFALVEIGVLFRNAHHDFRRTGNAISIPVT
jgi:hypothetical protein